MPIYTNLNDLSITISDEMGIVRVTEQGWCTKNYGSIPVKVTIEDIPYNDVMVGLRKLPMEG